MGDKYLLNLNLAQDPISALNLKTLSDINGICDIEREQCGRYKNRVSGTRLPWLAASLICPGSVIWDT